MPVSLAVIVKPETLHICSEESVKSLTASPDEAVGATVCVPPTTIAAGGAKSIVWGVRAVEKVIVDTADLLPAASLTIT